MIRTQLELDRLAKIAEITKPARNKHSWKKGIAYSYKYHQLVEKAFEKFSDFIAELVSKHVEFDPRVHRIFVPAIRVSPQADLIIQQILPGLAYVVYSPVVDQDLAPNECVIDEEKVLKPREEIN